MRFLQCASDNMETDMETTAIKSMHPLTAIAAVSVTLFSLAGLGAITGLIPTSHSQPAPVQAPATLSEPLKSAAAVQPAAPVATTTVTAAKPAVHKHAVKHASPVETAVLPAEPRPAPVKDESPIKIAQNDPAPRSEPAPRIEPAKPACYDCGVIESVREIEKKGEGSGLGAVAGGLAGGVLGRQTGGGRGRDVMTVLGAIGGAVAGNAVEKNVKKVKNYEVVVRFDDGTNQLITQNNPPAWRSGDRVRLTNGVITASN
jgi:outer membrane lipoprotein SlyB